MHYYARFPLIYNKIWAICGAFRKFIVIDRGKHVFGEKQDAIKYCSKRGISAFHNVMRNKEFKTPDEYDFLSCLQKYDPGTFDNFCSDFGYDNRPLSDHDKVRKIYEACVKEFTSLQAMFNDEELEQLAEIS